MEPLQQQVTILSNKLDALYQIVDGLSGKVSDALSECRLTPIQANKETLGIDSTGRYLNRSSIARPMMEHKDVLVDSNELDSHIQTGEKQLAPEIQIQRLTAQLTAAYNRIAALEEQLLARRIH
jgi:prophage DNA circulation protein